MIASTLRAGGRLSAHRGASARCLGGATGRCLASDAKVKLAKADGQDRKDGSSYENYNAASKIYDGIRHAGGHEVILGAFVGGDQTKPLHKQHVVRLVSE